MYLSILLVTAILGDVMFLIFLVPAAASLLVLLAGVFSSVLVGLMFLSWFFG